MPLEGLLAAVGLVMPWLLQGRMLLLQAADETPLGLGELTPFAAPTLRDVVVGEDPATAGFGKVLTVLGWTTVTVVAFSAIVGFFVFILFAAERTPRRGCGPVSIVDSRPSQRKP